MSGVAIMISTAPGYACKPDAKPNNEGYNPALPIEIECRCNAVKLVDKRHVNARWKRLMRSAYLTPSTPIFLIAMHLTCMILKYLQEGQAVRIT